MRIGNFYVFSRSLLLKVLLQAILITKGIEGKSGFLQLLYMHCGLGQLFKTFDDNDF